MRIKSFGVLTISLISLFSCSKYEEGPSFSFSSKKERLVGDWKLVKQTENNVEMDLENIDATATISANGTYSVKFVLYVVGIPFTDESNGNWKFNSNKTQVIFTETGASTSSHRTIIKLAENELKLKEVNNNEDVIVATYHPN